MGTNRSALEQLLASSEERLRISRALRTQARNSIRRSQEAVLESHAVLGRSELVLQQIIPRTTGAQTLTKARFVAPAPEAVSSLMQIVSNQTIEDQVVAMDGKHFIECQITNCVLEYSGQPLVLETTQFSGCSFRFKGESALTLNFLSCFGLELDTKIDVSVVSSQTLQSNRPN